MSKQQHDNQANKAKQKNLKKLLCKAIRFGTAQDVQRFRLFRDKIGSNNTNDKKKNPNPADEPLFVVMEKEDAKLYHEVFKFDLDLDCRVGPYDMTALHYAVETGKILAVAMLLYYGLDRDALTSENEVPIQLAKSRNMRSVFNDFKQMSRSNFAKKYKLKIPKQTPNSRPFPFHDLPLEIQELIWQFVPLHYLWNFQFVSHEWREYFRRKTNANSPTNNLFPRGQITWSVAISYYPTEYHFLSAKRFFDLSKKCQKDISQIFKDMKLENELQKKDGSDSSTKINAIKKLLMDEDGSNDYKEKIYIVEAQYGAQYYYIQKSHYFGIAIEHCTMQKLSKEESNEARRMMFMRYLQNTENELDQQIAQDRPVAPQQPKIRERFK